MQPSSVDYDACQYIHVAKPTSHLVHPLPQPTYLTPNTKGHTLLLVLALHLSMLSHAANHDHCTAHMVVPGPFIAGLQSVQVHGCHALARAVYICIL